MLPKSSRTQEQETYVRPFLRTRVDCRGFGGMTVVKSLLAAWENHGLSANDVHTDLGVVGLRMFWKEWNTTVGKKIDHGGEEGGIRKTAALKA